MKARLQASILAIAGLLAFPAPSSGSAIAAADQAPAATLSSQEAQHREKLFRYLAAATTEAQGRSMEDEIWRFWLDLAPTPESRAKVDQAMERREAYDFAAAEELLDAAIELAPTYAEAWNQRAFIRFLRDNDEGAEQDLLRTLELEPKHFGALSGLFHVLFRQGRTQAANAALVEAVRIHPWLKERTMLPPDPDAVRPPISGTEQDL